MIASGKYGLISIQEPVESAKEMLRIVDTTEFDSFLLKRANEAMTDIAKQDSSRKYKRVCDLDIIDGRVKIPNGSEKIIGLRLKDDNGNCFRQPYIDEDFIKSCGCSIVSGGYSPMNGSFEVQNGYIVFHHPTSITATKATVAWLSRSMDERGLMSISDRYERAIEAYCCWRFTMTFFEKFPDSIRREHKKTWINQKRFLVGQSKVERFEENRDEIVAIFNAWNTSDKNIE